VTQGFPALKDGRPCLRRADLDDADAIAAIHVQAWRETYSGLLPQHVIDARTIIERRREQARARLADIGSSAHVARLDDELVGFAVGGALREPVAGFDGELQVIYVLQRAQRHGLGEMLARAVARDLHERGFRSMAVRVLAENARAQGFYQHLGARFVELAPTEYIGRSPITDAVYGWDDLAALVL